MIKSHVKIDFNFSIKEYGNNLMFQNSFNFLNECNRMINFDTVTIDLLSIYHLQERFKD